MLPDTSNWKPEAPELAQKDFQSLWVLVHFWAPWNLVDRDASDRLANLEVPNGVLIRSCNIDSGTNLEYVRRAQIANVPTLALFFRGDLVSVLVGLRTNASVNEWVQQHIRGSI